MSHCQLNSVTSGILISHKQNKVQKKLPEFSANFLPRVCLLSEIKIRFQIFLNFKISYKLFFLGRSVPRRDSKESCTEFLKD